MKLLFSFATLTCLWTLAKAQSSTEASFKLRKEDNKFWDRFLQDDGSLSVEVPPATPPPALPPTLPPTPPPTELCILNLELNCTIGSGEYEGQACETPGVGVDPCRDRPTGATMLFNGGDCSQSDNRQFLQFTCVDIGAVPTEEGDMAYIVVTDAKGKGITYHDGFVAVGSNYYLRTPEGEERFEADQRIMIYANEDTGNPANLLQEVQYHSSCSSNLELKNRFGASQLVEFQNDLQGNVTCFATAGFDLDIVLPVEIEGTSATITKLTALTNFAGFLDLTDQVGGIEIPPGGTVKVSIPVTFDLTVRMRYTILTQVTAITNPSGQVCTGTDFNSFYAGNIPPGNVPTQPPLPDVTSPPAPTSNPLEAACGVSTTITCEYLNEDSRVIGACEDVPDSRTVSCTNNLPATGIQLRYTGTEPVTVVVSGGRSGVVFDGTVNPGEIFRADGDFRGEAEVSIEGGEAYTLNLVCAAGDSSLTLGNSYGPFELVGFVNSLGLVTSIHDLRLRYTVANTGGVTMVAEDATVTSSFQDGPIDAISSDQTVARGASVIVFEEVEEDFDFLAKFSSGTVNTFSMTASGRGSQSNLPCSAETTYSF